MFRKQARALSILHALESSLDFDKGGQVALGLAQIYREARRLIVSGLQTRSAEEMHQARHIINEIAEACAALGYIALEPYSPDTCQSHGPANSRSYTGQTPPFAWTTGITY